MEMKRVGEIMIPLDRFPHIPYWFTLRQALAELDQANTANPNQRGLPWVIMVFNAQNQLLGMLTHQDLLRGLRPDLLANQPSNYKEKLFEVKVDLDLYSMSFSCDKALIDLKRQIERPVSDFTTPIEVTVRHDDYVLETICLMIDKNLSLLPVVQDGQVAGTVFALDVLQAVAKLLI